MNPLDALHLQLRLEGREVVQGDLLRQVEAIPDEDMPLMVIALLSSKELAVYYGESLPVELRDGLGKQVYSMDFPSLSPLVDILKMKYPNLEAGHYKTYTFPERYRTLIFDDVVSLHKTDPQVQAFRFDSFADQVHAIGRDGTIISACVSARENDFCGEAWVYTEENHRHQGLAQKVVGAWAKRLMSVGKVPFYSHKIENPASAQLAKRLELEPVFEEITISLMNV